LTRKRKAKGRAAAPAALSLRAYAKRRGVSPEAVSKAVESGRLKESVIRVRGAPKIADPDLADREWGSNTRPRVDLPPTFSPPAGDPQGAPPPPDDVPDYYDSRAKREAAAARRETALADLAELDVLERKAELVPAADVSARWVEVVTVAKTKLLGLPTRIKQRLPHISANDVRVIDDLVREALENLADGR
jgi:hypothetical protein